MLWTFRWFISLESDIRKGNDQQQHTFNLSYVYSVPSLDFLWILIRLLTSRITDGPIDKLHLRFLNPNSKLKGAAYT